MNILRNRVSLNTACKTNPQTKLKTDILLFNLNDNLIDLCNYVLFKINWKCY